MAVPHGFPVDQADALGGGGIDPARSVHILCCLRQADEAGEEVDLIGKHFKTKSIYKGGNAVKANLAKGTGSSIIHFATHGGLDPIDSARSYLVMAVNATGQELTRSNRVGEQDYSYDIP